MQVFEIIQRKDFMSKLLKSDLFDGFEVREVIAHVAFKLVLDGKRNIAYFDDILQDSSEPLPTYLSWGEMRRHVYGLFSGHTLPTYFKIILATNADKTAHISDAASCFYLNIIFKDNHITCSTGTAYHTFTLDQSADTLWDTRIQNFLFKYDFL